MKKKTRTIAGVIVLLVGVLLGIQAVAVRHCFDGSGILYLLSSIILLIFGSYLSDSGFGTFFMYAFLFFFLAIGYHVQSHVTSVEPLCIDEDKYAEAPLLLQDTNVFCGPFVGCQYKFECVSNDRIIERSERCIHCGRPFSLHYPKLHTIKRRIAMVTTDRTLMEMDYI